VLGVAVAVVMTGCGGHARRAAQPRLQRHDASQLVSLARRVVRDAPADGCAAAREIATLSARARALVASGRVPVQLRAPLLRGVAAVVADAPACAPPEAAPAISIATPGRGKSKHEQHGKGNGHGHGHGHGNGDDEG